MAGKMRFAAIFVTLTSMLAAGGGAAYYYTQDGKLPFGLGADSGARLTAGEPEGTVDSHNSAAHLAAVESAWAEAGPLQADASGRDAAAGDSIATAHSAETAKTAAELPTGRYGPASDVMSSNRNAETAEVSAAEDSVPSTDDDYSNQAAAEPEPADSLEISDSGTRPSTLDPRRSQIARGQEPNAETAIEAIDAEADTNPAAAALQAATSDTDGGAASLRRAREAFRDTPQSATGERYGSAARAPRSLDAIAPQNAASINPFAAAPVAEAAAASDAATIEAIEPLPTESGALPRTSNAGRDEFSESAPTAISSEAQNQGARNAYSGASAGYGNQGGLAPLSREPNSFAGATPLGVGSAAVSDGTGRPGERALEGPQKPALVIQKIAPPEIQVGKSAKFLVKVQNVGGQTATDVVIQDEVPEGTRLVGTSPTADVVGAQLTWNIGKLSTGEERTVEIDVQPTSEGEVGSVATVSYSAQASAKTRCTMPQLAIRMTAPEEVMIGQEQCVKIELHNPGSGDATGVMLFETVPENVRHEAGAALEFEIGSLKAGETRELELVLVAEKAGKVVNVLSARADGNLQVQQQVEFEIIAPALAVTVDGPGRRYLERAATYQVIVENPGTAPAHDVELITKLPKGMQFVRANNMGEYDASSHAVYWSLAELPEGERGTVEVVAMPIETGTQTLAVEGRAQQGLTDQTEQQIMIEGIASIMFEVRDAEDPIEVGGETSYEIRVANEGTKAATNVRVSISLTPGMQVVSAEGETQHAQQGPGIVFEPIPQLAPKTDTLIRLKVKGTQPGDQRINVEVSTDDLSQPIRREESTRVFGDE